MQLSLELALRWTERLTALAVALQSLELLRLRRSLADDGVWRWSILRDEHARLPLLLRALFAVLLPYRAFVVLLALRLPLAAALTAGVRISVLEWIMPGPWIHVARMWTSANSSCMCS